MWRMNLLPQISKTASRQKIPSCAIAPRENRLERRTSARVWRRRSLKLVSAPCQDQETGTYYNYMRTYLPMVGRYGETDPIGLAGGINTFAYALNTPLKLTDALGLRSGGGGGGSECACKSFAERTWDRYRSTSSIIDSTIDSVLPWPINSATGLATAVGGGAAARSYGGRTSLQEATRLWGNSRASFSLFYRIGRPDIGRVAATSAVNAIAVGVAWNAGLLAGSALSELISGAGCE
jgi:RHS repeat-associated protein